MTSAKRTLGKALLAASTPGLIGGGLVAHHAAMGGLGATDSTAQGMGAGGAVGGTLGLGLGALAGGMGGKSMAEQYLAKALHKKAILRGITVGGLTGAATLGGAGYLASLPASILGVLAARNREKVSARMKMSEIGDGSDLERARSADKLGRGVGTAAGLLGAGLVSANASSPRALRTRIPRALYASLLGAAAAKSASRDSAITGSPTSGILPGMARAGTIGGVAGVGTSALGLLLAASNGRKNTGALRRLLSSGLEGAGAASMVSAVPAIVGSVTAGVASPGAHYYGV